MNTSTPNSFIVRMITAINDNDKAAFYKIAESYRETLGYGGNNWNDIERRLRQRPMTMMTLDKMSNDIKALLSTGELPDENVYLNEETDLFVTELIREWQNGDTYRYHNLGVRNKVLLYGPTGNGKTTIAKHFSRVAKLPFVELSSDKIVDSHLGATSAKIQKIFSSIQEPCVMFWDEIDSVAVERTGKGSNGSEHENNRIVNTLLINLEKLPNDVIFIAATNREDMLDTAFLRRFDELYEVKIPTSREKVAFACQIKNYYKLADIGCDLDMRAISNLPNFSSIKAYVIKEARRKIVDFISERDNFKIPLESAGQ